MGSSGLESYTCPACKRVLIQGTDMLRCDACNQTYQTRDVASIVKTIVRPQ
jgi:exosome complex RNA-binding protein Csl4